MDRLFKKDLNIKIYKMWANKKATSPKMKKLGPSNINKVSPAADNSKAAMSFIRGLPFKLIKFQFKRI